MTLRNFEPNLEADFDGATYERSRDHARLKGQISRIFNVMRDGEWRTVSEIHDITGDPENSIQAQLRNLRKEKFGGYTVEKRRSDSSDALWEYVVRV